MMYRKLHAYVQDFKEVDANYIGNAWIKIFMSES